MALQDYQIRQSGELTPVGRLRATSIEQAAQRYTKQTYGRRVIASRTTGTPRMSGWFQPYRWRTALHAMNSTGSPFHVSLV